MKKNMHPFVRLTDGLANTPYVQAATQSRLVLVIEYDCIPDPSDLEEVLDKCREQGGVEYAEFHTLNPIRKQLV